MAETDERGTEHSVHVAPVRKLADGIVGWRFVCACGREGKGWHRTADQAVKAGHDHIPSHSGRKEQS